jgi:hypothetical protein
VSNQGNREFAQGVIDGQGNVVISGDGLALASVDTEIFLVLDRAAASKPGGSPNRAVLASPAALLLAAIAIAVLALHGRQWRWTGFEGNTSLWNWLTMFVQPVALTALTVRLLTDERGWRYSRLLGATAAGALGLVALGGYSFDWAWTGFPGERLWDWLHLLLFPAVIVLLPEWIRRGEPIERRHQAAALVVVVLFTVTLVGGYDWGWHWTGFTGNSFRDWLDLLIAPFLLPVTAKVFHARQSARRAMTSQGNGACRVVSVVLALPRNDA